MMFNKQNAVHKLLTANLSCWMFQIYKKYKKTYDILQLKKKKRQVEENKDKTLCVKYDTENVHIEISHGVQRG